MSNAAHIQRYGEIVTDVSADATGTHDVYFVFRAEKDTAVCELYFLRFEDYRGRLPLQETEAYIEVRAGGTDGPVIGRLYPEHTGGQDEYRWTIAELAPISGATGEGLSFAVRSDVDEPMVNIDWFRLHKAERLVELTDPLRGGLYKATEMYRPIERAAPDPASIAAVRQLQPGPRPTYAAQELESRPKIDGALDEWPTESETDTIVLKETVRGETTSAPHSFAWIGYDDAALYIAVKHVVENPGALTRSHNWGAADGMEIAIQDAFSDDGGPILNLYGYPDGYFESVGTAGAAEDIVERLGEAVEYAAAIGPEAWTCEWRIPFSACGFTPQRAPRLLFNLGVKKVQANTWVILRGTWSATYYVKHGVELVFSGQ